MINKVEESDTNPQRRAALPQRRAALPQRRGPLPQRPAALPQRPAALPRRRATVLLAALLALIALLPGAPIAAAQSGAAVWSRVGSVGPDVLLEDVSMVGADLAWAVGRNQDSTKGYVYRMRLVNGRWEVSQDATFNAGLYGVAAIGATDVWVVGDGSLIMRRSGDRWQVMENATPGAELRDIQVLGSGQEAWAVGQRPGSSGGLPIALHYVNGNWERALIDAPEGAVYTVNALHLNNGGGWAVGSLIWRLDGNAWKVETMPNLCGGGFGCANGFSAVRTIDRDRAYAAGSYSANCGICSSKVGLAYRQNGAWGDAFGPNGWSAVMPPVPGADTHYLSALFFTDAANGLAVGSRNYDTGGGNRTNELFALRYVNGSWRYELVMPRTTASASALYLADASRGLLVGSEGLILSYGYGDQSVPQANPATRVSDPAQPGVAYFPETGHTMRGAFRDYWLRYGGLEQFGYPLSEEFSESGYTVQYFERARFEYHPENAGTRYEVLLGLLGNTITAGRRGEPQFQYSPPTNQPGSVYFPETGHSLAAELVGYWQRYGGLPIYGYPISEAFYEVNQADGKPYLVQYFERNRLEYHPENTGTRYEVLLGLLGSELLRSRGWIQ